MGISYGASVFQLASGVAYNKLVSITSWVTVVESHISRKMYELFSLCKVTPKAFSISPSHVLRVCLSRIFLF